MRIFNENTEHYIHSLASAVGKDPASMENWRCAHIKHTAKPALAGVEAALNTLQKTHGDAECDVVHCTDNDLLLISHSPQVDLLHRITNAWVSAIGGMVEKQMEIAHYDLFHDWRIIREVLLAKAGEPPLPVVQPAPYHFGEVSALQEVFAEVKKLRKARLPLHIMLVEDDPLTQRIVAGTFKEDYALITAANAQEAVANYLLHAPDIVFLDIGLPDASGFDVLHRIMESDPDAYVVMFSGHNYLDNITNALGVGASGFIAKPFKKEKMRRYIEDSALHHRKRA